MTKQVIMNCRGGGSGCAGCAIAHPIFSQMTIFISFLEKKKFEKDLTDLKINAYIQIVSF